VTPNPNNYAANGGFAARLAARQSSRTSLGSAGKVYSFSLVHDDRPTRLA